MQDYLAVSSVQCMSVVAAMDYLLQVVKTLAISGYDIVCAIGMEDPIGCLIEVFRQHT